MENFEDNLRKKLDDHQMPVDMDSIWEGVQANNQKKKRRFIFWWIFPALALTGLGIYLGSHSYQSSPLSNGSVKSKDFASNKSNISRNQKADAEYIQNNKIQTSQANNHLQGYSNAKSGQVNSQNNSNNKSKSTVTGKTETGKYQPKSNQTVISGSKLANSASNIAGLVHEISNSQTNSDKTTPELPQQIFSLANAPVKTEILEQIPQLYLFPTRVGNQPNFLVVHTNKEYTKKQHRSSIYAIGGMHAVIAQTDQSELLSCAKPKYGYNFEIGYQRQIRKSPFSYQIGLELNHILFHSENKNFVTKTIETYDSTIIFRQLNGEQMLIGNKIYGNQTTATIRNKYQRSYIFNGIVGLAYSKYLGKWSYGVNTGLGINFQTKSTGFYYCSQINERLDFSNSIKSNVGFSGRMGLNLGYEITRRIALITQLNTSYYFTPMSITGNAYKNVLLPSIQVGMKYKW